MHFLQRILLVLFTLFLYPFAVAVDALGKFDLGGVLFAPYKGLQDVWRGFDEQTHWLVQLLYSALFWSLVCWVVITL